LSAESPSMVVMSLLATSPTVMPQESTGRLPISTVHAPHCWIPQPNLVPVKPTVSRNAQSNGVSGSRLRVCCFSLIFNVVILPPWLRLNYTKSLLLIGSLRNRLPVAAKTALAKAGPIKEVPASPSPPGGPWFSIR